MKGAILWFGLGTALILSSCKNNGRYLDLSTNEHIAVKKDTLSGYIMNKKTGEPVDFYVDTKNHDTVYGPTGEIVNGRLHRSEGKWVLKPYGEIKARSESENSARLKLEDGDYKLKKGSYTARKDKDGDVKIENGRTQVKADGKTGKWKVKKDSNISGKVKKIFH